MSRITVDYGDQVKLTGKFSTSGAPVDPDEVVCSVQAADGSITKPSVTKLGVGEYRAFFTPPGPGDKEEVFYAVMDGLGANQAAQRPARITVRERVVPRPA